MTPRLSVAGVHENTIRSYPVNIVSTLGVIVGAVVSIVTLDALELEVALELATDIEDVLTGLDDIWLAVLELICDVTELTAELVLSVLLVATLATEEV